MVASYLLDAGERNHNLDELAQRYLQHSTTKIDELIGTGKNQKRMDEVPVGADHALRGRRRRRRLAAARRSWPSELQGDAAGHAVRHARNAADRRAGRAGIQRHQGRHRSCWPELSASTARSWSGWSARFTSWPAGQFNIASPKQLQEMLFDEQKLPVVKKTKTRRQHRRRRAGGAGPVASAAGQDHRVPAIRQAEEHVRRRPAADGASGDGPRACVVQPGRGGHRAG